MPKFELINAGDTLWLRFNEKAGNTSMRREVVHAVTVEEIDHSKRTATVRVNGRSRKVFAGYFDRLLKNKPETKPGMF